MKDVARLLNDMLSAGIIGDYAIFEAVAQMRYTPAVAAMDADILVEMKRRGSLDLLKPIHEFYSARGNTPDRETIRVGEWPVHFIPVFSPLTEEAVREAETGEIEGIPLRVVRADFFGEDCLKHWSSQGFRPNPGSARIGSRELRRHYRARRALPAAERMEAVQGALSR
jgi:hypothetical protein